MLAAERQRLIAKSVAARGVAKVNDLAQELGVSEMTIRRDIDVLSETGRVRKVHGGAVSPETGLTFEPGFKANVETHLAAKQAIAAHALTFVRPGMTIGVTAGSTTYQLAEGLAARGPLTVVTNSFPFAARLYAMGATDPASHPGGGTGESAVTLILTGGELTPSEALVGPVAEQSLANLSLDLCFMGVHGIHPDAGLSTPNLQEAATNKMFAAHAERVIVLADSHKFGVRALAKIADLDAIATVITETSTPETEDTARHLGPETLVYANAPANSPSTPIKGTP